MGGNISPEAGRDKRPLALRTGVRHHPHMAPVLEPAHPDTPGVRIPPPTWIALPLAAAWALERRWPWPLMPPRIAVPIALVCLGTLVVPLAALVAFRRARTTWHPWGAADALVTDGPYRWSRNPMYVGLLALHLAVTLLLNSTWGLVLFPAAVAALRWLVIAKEEAYLTRRFGDAYRDYCTRVRRWL